MQNSAHRLPDSAKFTSACKTTGNTALLHTRSLWMLRSTRLTRVGSKNYLMSSTDYHCMLSISLQPYLRRKGERTRWDSLYEWMFPRLISKPTRQHTTNATVLIVPRYLLQAKSSFQAPAISTSAAFTQASHPCLPGSADCISGDLGGWHRAGAWSRASITHLHTRGAESLGKQEKLPSFN